MKLIDFAKRSLHMYPTLYLFPTWEASYIRILDHTFGVIGNGLTWAKTKDLKKGGYLCQEEFRKYNGEWVRKLDKNYGADKYNFDMKSFFEEPVVCVYNMGICEDKFVGTLKEFEEHKDKKYWKENSFNFLGSMSVSEMFMIDYNVMERNLKKDPFVETASEKDNLNFDHYGWAPYPDFQKEYSPLWEDGSEYIQEDWKQGALYWLSECERFFKDPERIKTYHEYPTRKNIKELKDFILKYMEEGKYKNSDNVNEAYKTTCFSGENFEEMAWERWDKEFLRTLKFIKETKFKLIG